MDLIAEIYQFLFISSIIFMVYVFGNLVVKMYGRFRLKTEARFMLSTTEKILLWTSLTIFFSHIF